MDSSVRPSVRTVDRPKAASVLLSEKKFRFLKPFLARDATLAAAARELGVTVTALYHKVRQLEALGLVEVVGETPRRGRAVKTYRSTADEFVVPFASRIHDFSRELRNDYDYTRYFENFMRELAEMHEGAETPGRVWGVRVYRGDDGETYLEPANPRGQAADTLRDGVPALLNVWSSLRLDYENAKALQRALAEVVETYEDRAVQDGQQGYLLGVFLTPVRD